MIRDWSRLRLTSAVAKTLPPPPGSFGETRWRDKSARQAGSSTTVGGAHGVTRAAPVRDRGGVVPERLSER